MNYKIYVIAFACFWYTAAAGAWLYGTEEAIALQNQNAQTEIKFSSPNIQRTSPFSESEYGQLILKVYVSSENSPSYWFEHGEWKQEAEHCWIYGGDDEVISPYQMNMIKWVRYYRYTHINPLAVSSVDAQDQADAAFENRFCFYRFTGKTFLPKLDIYLFSLDMHTGLLFYYALPGRFDHILGHSIPRDWIALEDHPYIKKKYPARKFYEFDPIGSVQPDGKILLYDWAVAQHQLKKADIRVYIPHLDTYPAPASGTAPGYSPYRRLIPLN